MSATSHPLRGTAGWASTPYRSPAASSRRVSGRAQVGGSYGGERRPSRPASGGGRPGGPGSPRQPGYGKPPGRRPRPRWGRIALVALIVIAAVAAVGVALGGVYTKRLNDEIDRTDPFSALTNGRPAKTVDGAINMLLVGSDSRDPDAPVDKAGAWRADTIIVMHIPSNHSRAYLVSIPRDLYVPIPQDASAGCGGNRAKINAAFAFGGLPLAVRTVECFTDVRIDHVVAIDFGGFKEVTDALGGVDLKIERSITSIHKPYRKFKKGKQHLTGAQALDYIRQRKQFPDGDFARMRHQQEFLRALMDKATSTGTLTNPVKLNNFLKAVTKALTVDDGLSVVDMALQFRGLRSNNLEFVTSPHNGSQNINGESVVVSDRDKALAMYQAMAGDKMQDWAKENIEPSPSAGAGSG